MILDIALGIVLGLILFFYVMPLLIAYWWAWIPPVALAVIGLIYGGASAMLGLFVVGSIVVFIGKRVWRWFHKRHEHRARETRRVSPQASHAYVAPGLCRECGGRGQIDHEPGPFAFSRTCPACQGLGQPAEHQPSSLTS